MCDRKFAELDYLINDERVLCGTLKDKSVADLKCWTLNKTALIAFSPHAVLIATTRAFPIDYESDEVAGNSINTKDIASNGFVGEHDDYQDYGLSRDVDKREPEIFVGGQKRNIISALRAKMRRSKAEDVEDKLRFSPVLSVGEFKCWIH